MSGFFDSIEMMKWLYWLVGFSGAVGLIVLFVLFPVIARGLLAIVIEILEQLLGTRFGCAVLAAIVVGLGVNYMRASLDQKNFEEQTAQFEQKQKDRDVRIAAETRESVTAEIADLAESTKSTNTDVKGFTDAVPIVPAAADNPFLVGDDACQLRHIAGLPPCGSERAQGLQKVARKAARAFHRPRQRLPQAGSPIARPAP